MSDFVCPLGARTAGNIRGGTLLSPWKVLPSGSSSGISDDSELNRLKISAQPSIKSQFTLDFKSCYDPKRQRLKFTVLLLSWYFQHECIQNTAREMEPRHTDIWQEQKKLLRCNCSAPFHGESCTEGGLHGGERNSETRQATQS